MDQVIGLQVEVGASNVSYKPYGEIQRVDSFGPDVFRYKYTAQEEDRETGLYYYKARYYDPVIGRFLQADSLIDSSRPMAMDLYMYTEGNPISYTDPSGHSVFSNWLNKNNLGFLNFQLTLTTALLILNPVGMLANAIAAGMAGSSAIAIAGATALGFGIAASLIGGYSVVMGSATLALISVGSAIIGGSAALMGLSAATIVGAAGLAIGATALSMASAVAAAAAIAGVSAVLMAGAVAMTAIGAAIIVGLAAVAIAAIMVFTVVVLALAAALVAIAAIPILAATALAVGATAVVIGGMAIGSILSFWTLQAYVVGGFSKSSFNNIHWNERSAKQGACYAAAGQLGGMLAGAALVGLPGVNSAITWLPKFLTYFGYASTIKSAITQDWKSLGSSMLSYAIESYYEETIPIGLILDYTEGTNRTCGGIE